MVEIKDTELQQPGPGFPFFCPLVNTHSREDTQQSMYTQWQTSMTVPPSAVTASICHTPLVPNSLARPPLTWSKEEVRAWLEWCAGEFSIEPVSPEKFDMNGKALGLLNKTDFMERDPSSGDLLFNALQRLINKHDANQACTFTYSPVAHQGLTSSFSHPSPCHPVKPTPTPAHMQDHRQNGIILFAGSPSNGSAHTTFPSDRPQSSYIPILPTPVTSFPSSVPIQRDLKIHIPESVLSPAPTEIEGSMLSESESPEGDEEMQFDNNNSEQTENTGRNMLPDFAFRSREGDCRLLWEFIHQLLQENKYRDYVSWERPDELIFRIVNPTGLAELWGYQKNRTNMTYEKLSRALRYYYKMNIIKKVPGKRLTYQFLQHPRNIKKGQRGARPHAARVQQQGPVHLQPSPPKEEPSNPKQPEPQAEHPAITKALESHSPTLNPDQETYENCDYECDLQLIDGRLQPSPDEEEDMGGERGFPGGNSSSPFVKQEALPGVPEQEEPEDLSMKTLNRSRSLDSPEAGLLTKELSHDDSHVKMEPCS